MMTKRGAAQRNPWTAVRAEIAQLKEENKELRNQKNLADFAKNLGETLAMLMANKPPSQWTSTEKAAFKHCEEQTPTTGYLYRTQHANMHGEIDKLPLKYRV